MAVFPPPRRNNLLTDFIPTQVSRLNIFAPKEKSLASSEAVKFKFSSLKGTMVWGRPPLWLKICQSYQKIREFV